MFAFFKRRAFLVVVGFLLLALFVWFAGPYFSFAGYAPLESTNARLIAIGLMVLAGVGYYVWKRFRANRAGNQLMAAVVKQSEREQSGGDALRLREQFENAVATLKQKHRGGHSLYELPWYVIIGAPGSGKTTALVNSGLHFPIEQRTGKGALRGVGGTRNCDWWFTDEAIFLDTAGRYTTQDSDAGSDSAGWAEFLALLRKYRGRRPVNGVILTTSVQDLLVQNQAEREAYAEAARRRLDELNRELRVQLPVYLMVTKCDLVPGFTEYFDDLEHEGRAQVWGVTFPHEQTLKGEAAREFPEEFDRLMARLNERLFARLEDERDARRRPRIFGFPQQLGALRAALLDFVQEVFTSTRFDRQILLRGVYFTSGTQEGTPIDRLLGALGRGFAVAADAVSAPPGRGKAYFIERLLKQVLLGESGLAGVNRRLEAQQAAAQLGAYVAMIVLAVLAIIAFTVSYNRNRTYIRDVAGHVDKLRDMPGGTARASLETVLPRLDAVQSISDAANRYRNDVPWGMGWGLYQGNALGDAARNAYSRELDGALLTAVASRFEQRLREYGQQPEALYEYLKAYLMLDAPQRLNKSHLGELADLEWEGAYAHDPAAGKRLSEHFRRLLQYEDRLRPVTLDKSLIAQARSTIRQASIPRLMFGQLQLEYANDSRVVRLDQAAGVGFDQVFRRKSGVNLSEPVPAIFTKKVFQEITAKDAAALVKKFEEDSWVWGEEAPSITISDSLAKDFDDVYEKEYIRTWEKVLADFELVPLPTLDKTKEALAILGRPTSPLRGFLKVVDENTYLAPPEDPAQPKGGIRERLGGILDRGKRMLGVPVVRPGLQITTHFDQIHRLVAGEVGAAPLDRVLDQIRQIQQKVEPVGAGVGETRPDNPQAMAAIVQSANALKRDATTLPPSVGAVVTQLGDRTAAVSRAGLRGSLESRYQQDVFRECTETLNGRYPFSPGNDLPIADFGRLFGYGGLFDTFFKNELDPLVDTSRPKWDWRPGASGASIRLMQFEEARRIREMFFLAGRETPELHFTVTPIELDTGARRFQLEIDGQTFEHRHGPERSSKAKWPGDGPGMAAASFEAVAGGRENYLFNGPWAWFRLMEVARIEQDSQGRFVLTFAKGAHSARVRIEPDRARNPYATRDFQKFRCG